MGNLKRNIKNSRILKKNVVNLNEISGTLSKEEKEKKKKVKKEKNKNKSSK